VRRVASATSYQVAGAALYSNVCTASLQESLRSVVLAVL